MSDASDSDSESSPPQEAELRESPARLAQRAKQRAAFCRLARTTLALLAAAIVLSLQPLAGRPRQAGVNRVKLAPLPLALCAALHWAKDSPQVARAPQLAHYLNNTARVLLTPYEYGKARGSKRAMPNEKTWAGAYKKTERALGRIADSDASLLQFVAMPMPNMPVLGSAAVVAGSFLSILMPGLEYATVVGCGALYHSCISLGLEAQPELYVLGTLALLATLLSNSTQPPGAAGKRNVKRKLRKKMS